MLVTFGFDGYTINLQLKVPEVLFLYKKNYKVTVQLTILVVCTLHTGESYPQYTQ